MKVLCLWHASDAEISLVQSGLPPGAEVVAAEGDYLSRFDCSLASVEKHSDADAIIAFSVPPGILELATNLKIFSWLHSGVDDLRQFGALALFKERGVKVANIRGANAIAVAEQAMMFVLALAKKAILKNEAAREGRLLFPLYADEYRSCMLEGRTIGVIGLGNIGSRIAKHAKGFDMNVLGVRREAGLPAEHVDRVYGIENLHSVLPECDFIVLATPSTPETLGLLGAAELSAMKSSAYLVNISRGMLIEEKALYEALTTERLRGYAADVWWQYEYGRTFPIGWGSRLGVHRLPNVIASYDQAANADDVLERNIRVGAENVHEFVNGDAITRQVRIDLGY